jgi:hypothetical protein
MQVLEISIDETWTAATCQMLDWCSGVGWKMGGELGVGAEP